MKSLRPRAISHLPPSLPSQTRQCRLAYLTNPTTFHRPTNHNRQPHRTFLSNPLTPSPQTISATRTLHYPASTIYAVITDIASYSHFVPYCRSSVITKTSAPTKTDGKEYPEEAKLEIGFSKDMSEEFWSRVYCAPEKRVVEAVSGGADTTLSPSDISHHNPRPTSTEADPTRQEKVLSRLLTRWTLHPYPYKPPTAGEHSEEPEHKNAVEGGASQSTREETEVSLQIEFQFANPLYAAMSQAAVPRVAEKMIEAFEGRVRSVVEGKGG